MISDLEIQIWGIFEKYNAGTQAIFVDLLFEVCGLLFFPNKVDDVFIPNITVKGLFKNWPWGHVLVSI